MSTSQDTLPILPSPIGHTQSLWPTFAISLEERKSLGHGTLENVATGMTGTHISIPGANSSYPIRTLSSPFGLMLPDMDQTVVSQPIRVWDPEPAPITPQKNNVLLPTANTRVSRRSGRVGSQRAGLNAAVGAGAALPQKKNQVPTLDPLASRPMANPQHGNRLFRAESLATFSLTMAGVCALAFGLSILPHMFFEWLLLLIACIVAGFSGILLCNKKLVDKTKSKVRWSIVISLVFIALQVLRIIKLLHF